MNEQYSVTVLGWGRWGRSVLKEFEVSKGTKELLADTKFVEVSEESVRLRQFCPDPLAAELYFDDLAKDLAAKVPCACRLHLIHAGEHFATGALTAFLRYAARQEECIDIGIVLLPPPGANSATVGRFCVNLYGRTNFFDATLLLDACSPVLMPYGEEQWNRLGAELVSMFRVFERSSCMIPLLLRMRAKSLSLSMMRISDIVDEFSFKKFVPAKSCVSMPCDVRTLIENSECLAFSVAGYREKYLGKVLEHNIGREKLIYIPFFRLYEWDSLLLPKLFHNVPNDVKNFAGLFFADLVPKDVRFFLNAYARQYWQTALNQPQEVLAQEQEEICYDTWLWLKMMNINKSLPMQNYSCLREASKFIRMHTWTESRACKQD